jgi:hypothetical protein
MSRDGCGKGKGELTVFAAEISGTGEWEDAYGKAKEMVAKMSLEEKVSWRDSG